MPRAEVILAALSLTVASAAAAQPKHPAPLAKPPLSAFQQEQRMSFGQRMQRWEPLLADASRRFNVPEKWLRAVMLAESGGRTMQGEALPIKSGMGALGLMQLMPGTYSEMRKEHGLGANPYDPHDNIFAAAAYLHWLHAKYGYPRMFAAYNDGPGNLEARMKDLGLLPRETQAYVAKVTGMAIAGGVFARGKLKFTRPNGIPVTIEGASVRGIRAPFPGEYADGVQTVITAGRLTQGVRESLAAVKATIRAHGGAA
jgi:soluble lytic murein transglycosylase-like protein